jgi:hypothetical protein
MIVDGTTMGGQLEGVRVDESGEMKHYVEIEDIGGRSGLIDRVSGQESQGHTDRHQVEYLTGTNFMGGKKNPKHNWTETNFKGLDFKRTREWKEHLDHVFEQKGVFKNVKYSTLSEHDEKRRNRAKREFFTKKNPVPQAL